MASICCHSVSFPPIHKSPKASVVRTFSTILPKSTPFSRQILKLWSSGIRATNSRASSTVRDGEEARKPSEESMSIDNLRSFFNLNLGKWNGSFFVSIKFLILSANLKIFRRWRFRFCLVPEKLLEIFLLFSLENVYCSN